jgi:hypothetical protein
VTAPLEGVRPTVDWTVMRAAFRPRLRPSGLGKLGSSAACTVVRAPTLATVQLPRPAEKLPRPATLALSNGPLAQAEEGVEVEEMAVVEDIDEVEDVEEVDDVEKVVVKERVEVEEDVLLVVTDEP